MKSMRLLMILLLLFTIFASRPLNAQQSILSAATLKTSIWQPIEDQHYIALKSQGEQNPVSKVQFYFWPGSASCYQFELALQKWQLTHPTVEVSRIPLVKRPSWRLLSKAYLVAEELNLTDTFINQLYQAIHQHSQSISNKVELEQFLRSQNIDSDNFMTLFSSALINQKLQSIELSNQMLPLNGVPTITINGQWLSDATMAVTSAKLLKVIEHLSPQPIEVQ